MKLKELFTDDRAVSPVIGVILMVAITVILAAVIGTFVLGLGNNLQQTPPNANFQLDYKQVSGTNTYNVTATHTGGETITSENAGNLTLTSEDGGVAVFQLPVSSGSSTELNSSATGDSEAVGSGVTVRVVWTSPDGSNSQTLAEGSTPS